MPLVGRNKQNEQSDWDAPPRSPHEPQLPPCTAHFSKELAASLGSITKGLSKPTHELAYVGNAKVEACRASPPYPNSTQLSLGEPLHASGYCLASACQPTSITAAFQGCLLQTQSLYQQSAPERTWHLQEENKCRRFKYLPLVLVLKSDLYAQHLMKQLRSQELALDLEKLLKIQFYVSLQIKGLRSLHTLKNLKKWGLGSQVTWPILKILPVTIIHSPKH